MERHEYALIKIEEAFSKLTSAFDDRILKEIKGEERKNMEAHVERERKKTEKRKALIAEGLPIPDDLKRKKQSRESKIFKMVPDWLTDTHERSFELSMVRDIKDLKSVVTEYAKFLQELKDGTNDDLSGMAWDLIPKAQKILSLLHIHRANPEDAIKRATNLMEPKWDKSKKMVVY